MIALFLRFLARLNMRGLLEQRPERASKDLWRRMREMPGVFERQGFHELAGEMDDALQAWGLASDVYAAVAVCARKALNQPGLDAETREKLRAILKMLKSM